MNRLEQMAKKQLSSVLFTPDQIVKLVLPIIVDQSFIIGMAIFNTAMISSAGIAAVSAVNMVESLNIFLVSIFIALATGGTVLVAQARGKRDQALLQRAATNTLVTVFLLAFLFSLLMLVFHQQILTGIFGGSSEAVMKNARIYYIGSVASYPALAIVEAACGVLRGVADTKTSFFLSFVTNFSYVGLNLLFILVFHFGIVGMSVAINIARIAGALLSLWYLLYRNEELAITIKRMIHLDRQMMKRVLVVGFPFAAEQLFFNGGKIITQIFIVGLGTLALTSNAIATSLTMLLEIIPGSLTLALVPIVGQSIGAGDTQSVKRFWRAFVVLSSLATLVTGGLLLLLYPWIIKLFNAPASVENTVFWITVMVMIFRIIFWPVSFITPSALRAAGDANFTSLISLSSMWGVRIVLGYLLGITFHYGLYGIWAAMCLEWGVRGAIFALRLRSNAWMKKRLV